MPKLPSISGREVVRAFEAAGFHVDRIEGSHHVMVKPGHFKVLSVPVHKGTLVKRGTLRSLIRNAGLTVEEFVEYQKTGKAPGD